MENQRDLDSVSLRGGRRLGDSGMGLVSRQGAQPISVEGQNQHRLGSLGPQTTPTLEGKSGVPGVCTHDYRVGKAWFPCFLFWPRTWGSVLSTSRELYPVTQFLFSTEHMSGSALDTWVHPGTKQAQTLPCGASVAMELCSVQPVQLHMSCMEAPR